MPNYPQKITFGELCESGVHGVLVYCRDHQCSHHIEVSADGWPDHVRLSDIELGLDPSLTVGSIERPGPPDVPLLFLGSNLCVKSGFFPFDLLAEPLKRPNLLD